MNNNNNNNNIDIIQRQEALKRRWHDSFYTRLLTNNPNTTPTSSSSSTTMFMPKPPHIIHQGRSSDGVDRDRELVRNIVPAVTVVLEGRSICQRINLHNHASYQSLAKALRQMFADTLNVEQCDGNDNNGEGKEEEGVEISNAIPGHLVAYEDLENDLLLAGDLHWKDFVRVAKRIRILPAKASKLRKGPTTKH